MEITDSSMQCNMYEKSLAEKIMSKIMKFEGTLNFVPPKPCLPMSLCQSDFDFDFELVAEQKFQNFALGANYQNPVFFLIRELFWVIIPQSLSSRNPIIYS